MIRKALYATTAALALVGLAAAPSSAQYGPDEPTMSVSMEQVPQGGSYTLSGEAFDANTTYEIGALYQGEAPAGTRALPNDEGSEDLGTVTTDDEGAFSTVLAVAADADLGFYDIGIDENIAPTGETGPEGETIYSTITTARIEVVAAATPTTTPGANNNGAANNGGALPRTGSSTLPLVGTGLGLLATGGALLFINKRRSIV